MTNEELVQAIQRGKKELTAVLWDQVKAWIHAKAVSFFYAKGKERGLTVEDLQQTGFLAMLDAADHYDQNRGNFITCLTWYLQSYFYMAAGLRTEKQVNDPINSAISIYQTLDDDGDTSIIDLQESPQDAIKEAEERIYNDQLQADLLRALARLPEQQRHIVKEHYLKGRGLAAIAAELDTTQGKAKTIEDHALRTLQRDKRLREYIIDDLTPWYLRASYGSMYSPVEVIAEIRERFREDESKLKAQITVNKSD